LSLFYPLLSFEAFDINTGDKWSPIFAMAAIHFLSDTIASFSNAEKCLNLAGRLSRHVLNSGHLAFCAHYVTDLSMPLHNTVYNDFNRKNHSAIKGIINDEVLDNLDKIKIYQVTIDSKEALAREIARIADQSMALGYKIQAEDRLLTTEEGYRQISHSASLFRGIPKFVEEKTRDN
jgi:hypothetical protein